jgi:SHS2 domain-containing protein
VNPGVTDLHASSRFTLVAGPPNYQGGRGTVATHEFVEHVSELALRVRGASFEELLAEVVRALGAELVREAGGAGAAQARTLDVTAVDREAILVDLLNEVVFLAETAQWAPHAVEWVDVSPERTRARVRAAGIALAGMPSRIKAATFHGLRIREARGAVAAEVIFDV